MNIVHTVWKSNGIIAFGYEIRSQNIKFGVELILHLRNLTSQIEILLLSNLFHLRYDSSPFSNSEILMFISEKSGSISKSALTQ